jgi:hypothetical protein
VGNYETHRLSDCFILQLLELQQSFSIAHTRKEKIDKKLMLEEDLENKFYSSNPNDSAMLEKFTYESKYCLPFDVITKVFLPSNSILLIKPAPVKFSKNFDNRECDRFAFVNREVVLMPS